MASGLNKICPIYPISGNPTWTDFTTLAGQKNQVLVLVAAAAAVFWMTNLKQE